MVPPPPATPILNRHMFNPPAPTPIPTPVLTLAKTPIIQPGCSTRSNKGQAPEVLDSSNHLITQHINITDYSSAPVNTSPIKHYCNMLGIKLPSRNYGQTASQGGFKRILYSLEQKEKEPKIQ